MPLNSIQSPTSGKRRLYWTIQICGWFFYASVEILTSVVAAGGQGLTAQRVGFLLYEAACCLLLTHLFRGLIHRWQWIDLSIYRLSIRVILSVFVMGITMYFLRVPGSLLLDLYRPGILFSPGTIFGLSVVYLFIFLLWSVTYFVYNYFERYNNSLKLEASMREIELNNLKSQLNPHFIFNALNSIRSLVDENPPKSKQAITQLSNLLRSSLSAGRSNLTSLSEELSIVKDYLGLESIRFEERLRTEFDIDPDSLDFPVPPLMLQTLVENCIKHGISKLTKGGLVRLETRLETNRLRISIRNTGQFHGEFGSAEGGMGLENTRQRLRLIYGEGASFSLKTENNNFVLTEIEIPYVHAWPEPGRRA